MKIKKFAVIGLLATMVLGVTAETATVVSAVTTDSVYNEKEVEKYQVLSKVEQPVFFENLADFTPITMAIPAGSEAGVYQEQKVADIDYLYVNIDDQWGWVEASDFTTILDKVPIDEKISIINEDAAIYKEPESSSQELQQNFKVSNGTYDVLIKGVTSFGEFYQIYDEAQVEGWINSSDVEMVSTDETDVQDENEADLSVVDETNEAAETQENENFKKSSTITQSKILFEYGIVSKNQWDIWEQPYEAGVQSIGKSNVYFASGEIIKISSRVQTSIGTYVLIQTDEGKGFEDLGWINEKGIQSAVYNDTKEVYQQFSKTNWDIWNTPYSTRSKSVGKTTNLMNEKLLIKKVSITKYGQYNNIWVFNKNTKTYEDYGWVNKNGLKDLFEVVIDNQYVTLKVDNWDIWDSPYTNQSRSVAKTNAYKTGEILLITRSATTNAGSYYRIWSDDGSGYKAIGWVRSTAVQAAEYKVIPNEYKRISKANWTIWDTPYSRKSSAVGNTNTFRAQTILLTRRATTIYGTYVKVWARDASGSFKELGWLNEDGLTSYDEKVVPNAYTTITKTNWDVWEQPFTTGVKSVGKSQNYSNQTLLVTREARVGNTLYLRIWSRGSDGKFVIRGWINANGTSYNDQVFIERTLNENMQVVSKRNWTIWDKPYVTGAKQKLNSTSYLNKNVVLKKEAVTNYGTYILISYQGKDLGWINKDGLSSTNKYILDSAYYSQTTIGAWSGCAAVSLFTALRMKGYATNVNLTQMINNLPLHASNTDLGQIGTPWGGSATFRAVISPVGLTNYAKNYTSTAANISNASIDAVQKEIMLGNPVLFWGKWNMGYSGVNMTPTHVLIIRGYEKTSVGEVFLVQDVGFDSANANGAVRWVSKTHLNNYLNTKQRKMMVIR
ncbi:hypothetical protein A5886_002054 [Enterococcus sp. 8G7_MSG3316]|uniref:GW domain-containing protein n=1 Tax=Candidatus Enterococcus testudinis TaxID=1834191 RepID=A0A242A7G0_9ENTE|nr:GW dipeptide domain-containing protein [Enterococcus sp. 8G7_MSG3316]OTN76975.1 hypothetical protein A5886_002054 [Enterococcus sp. 8G7_MSG3316]